MAIGVRIGIIGGNGWLGNAIAAAAVQFGLMHTVKRQGMKLI